MRYKLIPPILGREGVYSSVQSLLETLPIPYTPNQTHMTARNILLSLCILAAGTIHAAETPDALRLSLKEGKGNAVEIAFISNPVITYADNGNLIITVDGTTTEYPQSDILKMTFFKASVPTSILNAFDDGQATPRQGIYTTDGKQTDNIKTKGIYIINGKKVLVK